MATLDELVARRETLDIGQEYEVDGQRCKHCRSENLVVRVKLEAVPGSLAGVQVKTSARKIYVLCCHGCKRESGS